MPIDFTDNQVTLASDTKILAEGIGQYGYTTPALLFNLGGFVSGVLPVAKGGTGATTAPAALTNLGGTTAGQNIFKLATPGAGGYLQVDSGGNPSVTALGNVAAAIGAARLGSPNAFTATNSFSGMVTLTGGYTQTGGTVTLDATAKTNWQGAVGMTVTGKNIVALVVPGAASLLQIDTAGVATYVNTAAFASRSAANAFTAANSFSAMVTLTGGYTQTVGSVVLDSTARLNWLGALNIGRATVSSIASAITNLLSLNTMTIGPVEIDFATAAQARIADLDSVAVGDTWEILQMGAGQVSVIGTTAIAGQVVTLRYATGAGVKTPAQYGTSVFARIQAKAGTGAAATATLLIQGGVA